MKDFLFFPAREPYNHLIFSLLYYLPSPCMHGICLQHALFLFLEAFIFLSFPPEIDIGFHFNSPRFGIAHALCLGLAPWLAAEIPILVDSGMIKHKDDSASSSES